VGKCEPTRSKLADQVDAALRAFWQGDSAAINRLVAPREAGGASIGEHLQELCAVASAGPALPEGAVPGYRILREIGRGGMGVVYEAVQEGTNRRVALKVMLPHRFGSAEARARFRREVELSARLDHPGIVRIFESRPLADGALYYSMQFVDGLPLDRYLARARPAVRDVVRLFVALCDAVAYAHRQGIIHRDLKPRNVIVDEEGSPHVVDFGLAKALETSAPDHMAVTVTEAGQILGTVRYLSPEQVAGRPELIGARSDVYSLGVMLFEALTGQMPYDMSGGTAAVLHRIASALAPRPSLLNPSIDSDLSTILLKALEKDIGQRYACADDFGADLRRWLDGEPILARPPGTVYRLRRKLARRWRLAAAAGVLLLLAGAAAGVALVSHVRLRNAAARDLLRRADAHLRAREYAEAFDMAGGAIRLGDPEVRAHAYVLRGHVCLCREQYADAIQYYTDAAPHLLARGHPWPLYHRATAFWILGRRDDAAEDYRRVLEVKPAHLYAAARLYLVRSEQARLLEQEGQTEAARRLEQEAQAELAEHRPRAEPGSWLADVAACVAREITPEELLARAASESILRRCEAYYYAAEVCLAEGRIDQARRWFADCVATDQVLDMHAANLAPMSEWHLARWRLKQLAQ
jgi:tetratricopeptide (TPR) repeat protein